MEVAASRNEGCDQDFRLSGAAGVLGKRMRMQVRSAFPIQENCMGDGPDAVIFDRDGVITFTARVHAAAWKEVFDDHLRARAVRMGASFRPFDAAADYYTYVDRKPRYDGVQSFLKSRAIDIPHGSPSDSPEDETICGLGNRKDNLFNRKSMSRCRYGRWSG
jgi:hypothetical protein